MEKALSDEEIYCEKHFNDNVSRSDNGQFIVKLPFKNELDYPVLGNSRKCAIATQLQLEKRFGRNPDLEREYSKFIREGIELGHIEEVHFDPNSSDSFHYLPHHCVFKESTTTKLRVVYNASQKTSNGKSLNDFLAIGRVEQSDIISLLLKFRTFRHVFMADVEKMY